MADARPTLFLGGAAIYAGVPGQFSRPMTGHTPRKLPAMPQSPASSQCVVVFPTHRKHILPLLLSFVKHFSRNFFNLPKKFFGRTWRTLKSVSDIHENRFILCFSRFPWVIICFFFSLFKMVFCPNIPVFSRHFVDMHYFPRPNLFLSKPVSFYKKNVYTSITRPIIPSFWYNNIEFLMPLFSVWMKQNRANHPAGLAHSVLFIL